MPRSQVLRDDDVERVAYGLLRRIAEDARSTGIPEGDEALAIGSDNGVRSGREDGIGKTGNIR